MGFFKRISDIISANLNEMAEHFEDPETMLRQAIREMEESIGEVTGQTAKAMANEKTLSRELERNRAQSAQWQERAKKAVEAGDDALARKALARKNECEKLVAALEDQLTAAREASRSAPDIPASPPITTTRPRVPLCSRARKGGSREPAKSSVTRRGQAGSAAGCPMSATTTSPTSSRAIR
jgi:DNA repair exonuclease SbcCD ATPase subunit